MVGVFSKSEGIYLPGEFVTTVVEMILRSLRRVESGRKSYAGLGFGLACFV